MHVPIGFRQRLQEAASPHRRLTLLGWTLALLVGLTAAGGKPLPSPPTRPARLAQGQAAWQFLRAVLRGDYSTAYSRLAPEVRRAVSLERFEEAAQPLWKSGQRRGQEIELYKLGVRLGAGNSSRMFYAFTFAADSGVVPPPAILEVTFRDTATRAVLSFGLRPGPRPVPQAKPVPSNRARKR
ncbi:hypothetical protein [Hymenobacter arizonensis]|uniref:DUF3887 domain-containing protein n=1 Tax=Hymenobacter arizonensis TaxID=1227077 RepID=A0A1I6ABE4_HYMAR|nr:hypothetical protein [Hymenobacter arizonensis]SFQ65933.1 hypothetical protein SAMN04515668_3501 [Hymenobacter arizonensis]